ncbi:ceramidase domain-containing protein [Pseudofulvibacter geojedonensis]|uniref:Ceramidase domain-containing protein n=1 Tax=Pseudofulvibacter geojedonensis TaxID=1123758 RepID=A0ABW3I491_9FLAO
MKKNAKLKFILFGLLAISAIVLCSLNPILQDPNYHFFSDQNSCLTIPNCWNVLSNLPFFIVGIYGLISIKSKDNIIAYRLFFIGVSLVAFGSGYYHLHPSNQTLVWDRLPMTIAFMGLFSVVLSEFINKNIGKKALLPLLLFGIVSILYWVFYEDLRLYILVQFYPIIAIPIILLFYKSKNHSIFGYWLLIICYGLAKVFEYFDTEIHQTLNIISGHSLKHIAAALGIYLWIRSLQRTIS